MRLRPIVLTNDVVSKRILNQCQGMVGDFSNKLNPLRVGGVVNASLKDTASVTVSRNFNTVSGDGVVDELEASQPGTIRPPCYIPGCPPESTCSSTFE